VVACEQEPSRLLDAWQDAETAIVVDAAASGADPGTLHRYEATAEPAPARALRSSTHAFGLGQAIELARALGKLPSRVVVYAIEGQAFEAGNELSPAVAAAVEPTVAAVLAELGRSTVGSSRGRRRSRRTDAP
jgi:hydrogenase maturation protease